MRPLVSVVIPTYKRPGLLARCLAALEQQDPGCGAFEIIVADDEPSAETERVVRLCSLRVAAASRVPVPAGAAPTAPPLPIRYIPMRGEHGPAAARNAGWRAAAADVVAFTDDDCVPSSSWLREGLAVMREGFDAASGRIIVPIGERPTGFEANMKHLEESPFATANCFYRRDALERLGGFDQRFTTAWREDTDLYFRALDAGMAIGEAPLAVVLHPVRNAPWGISLREQRKSMFNALLYKKHARRYREQVQARPPWRYYAFAATIAGGVLAALIGQWPVALAAAVIWLAQVGAFAAKRLRGTSHAPSHVLEMAATSALIPLLSIYWRLRGALKFRVPFL